MVCDRCIMVVRDTLEQNGIALKQVILGEAESRNNLSVQEKEKVRGLLLSLGFELIDDKKSRIIEKIKNVIIRLVRRQDGTPAENLSDILQRELHQDYHALSKLFSTVEGVTIEKYYIAQKIERVKELLVYDELSLSEIAGMLNYSGVAYLSNQFKKVTGLSPSHFKQVKAEKRTPLDKI